MLFGPPPPFLHIIRNRNRKLDSLPQLFSLGAYVINGRPLTHISQDTEIFGFSYDTLYRLRDPQGLEGIKMGLILVLYC